MLYQLLAVAVLALSLTACPNTQELPKTSEASVQTKKATSAKTSFCQNQTIAQSFADRRSDVQVLGCGKVVATLKDDTQGTRHQKFIVRLDGFEQTVQIAHNIDLASKVSLQKGDAVQFYGEYEYNDKGGVVHWTHHDPAGRHQDGWIEFGGKKFQ